MNLWSMRQAAAVGFYITLLAIGPLSVDHAQSAEFNLPTAGPGRRLPPPAIPLRTIAFGAAIVPKPIPIFNVVASQKPDLFIFLGDNVCCEIEPSNSTLPELRALYGELAASPNFRLLRRSVPTLATWDDHDYGENDGGGSFRYKATSARVFKTFWNTTHRLSGIPGIYDSYTFGPTGRRTQIILLDDRYDRGPLAHVKETFLGNTTPSTSPHQRMLSEAQWNWLAGKLREPANLRFIVSSTQVMADGHHWESWRNFPLEQQRLFRLIGDTKAKGVIFISGDRLLGAIYRRKNVLAYPAYEITSSGLNLSFTDVAKSSSTSERSTGQLAPMYTKLNYGVVSIDWQRKQLRLEIRNAAGSAVRSQRIAFAEIGAN
jgi:alkaline phosphatase D